MLHPEQRSDLKDRPLMLIYLFNVKYSPNLGDGVIAECLEAEIRRSIPYATVQSIDLAGRTSWVPPRNSWVRAAALGAMRRLPRWASDNVVELVLARKLQKSLKPIWSQQLAGASFVIFGGGQLFQDPDLNFPLKLSAAHEACRSQNLQTAIFSVGVSQCHSPRGRSLLRTLLNDPNTVHIGVRDEQSLENLADLSNRESYLSPDPGLLASRLWPAEHIKARARPMIGLGVTHPSVLKHHSASSSPFSHCKRLYQQTIQSLLNSNFDVVCFTNGAGEDERFLGKLLREHQLNEKWRDRVQFAPRAAHPRDLARLISQLDAVIAHRLHTNILAYSYKVPHIGLTWDPKLHAFFDSIDRSNFLISLDEPNSRSISSRVIEALETGISTKIHSRLLGLCADGIEQLAARVVETAGLEAKLNSQRNLCSKKLNSCENHRQSVRPPFSDNLTTGSQPGGHR